VLLCGSLRLRAFCVRPPGNFGRQDMIDSAVFVAILNKSNKTPSVEVKKRNG
jgi:hypothetical protein